MLWTLFSSNDLLPQGFCYQWNSILVWLHVISDTLIAVAYFSIPPILIYLVKKDEACHLTGCSFASGLSLLPVAQHM